MFYDFDITTTASTAEADPNRSDRRRSLTGPIPGIRFKTIRLSRSSTIIRTLFAAFLLQINRPDAR